MWSQARERQAFVPADGRSPRKNARLRLDVGDPPGAPFRAPSQGAPSPQAALTLRVRFTRSSSRRLTSAFTNTCRSRPRERGRESRARAAAQDDFSIDVRTSARSCGGAARKAARFTRAEKPAVGWLATITDRVIRAVGISTSGSAPDGRPWNCPLIVAGATGRQLEAMFFRASRPRCGAIRPCARLSVPDPPGRSLRWHRRASPLFYRGSSLKTVVIIDTVGIVR
jgi:hypothetical protein